MFSFILLSALAAPPSSSWSSAEGALTWCVRETSEGIAIDGESPSWRVSHVANDDFSPIRTTRVDAEGDEVRVAYRLDGATVARDGRTVSVRQADLWDGDTLDVRLGYVVGQGQAAQRFSAIDSSSGKVYDFDSQWVAEETCGAERCTHVRVQLSGLLRWVGPSFNYWFAADGRLLRFEGPAGTSAASGV